MNYTTPHSRRRATPSMTIYFEVTDTKESMALALEFALVTRAAAQAIGLKQCRITLLPGAPAATASQPTSSPKDFSETNTDTDQ
jgi:hypothetical protein